MNVKSRFCLLFILLPVSSALACSIEVWPIEQVVPSTPYLVVGVVESLEEFLVGEGGDGQVRGLTGGRVKVERVLKGNLETEAIDLVFDPELAFTSCADLAYPYQEGQRVLLMLGEPQPDGRFRASWIPPMIIHLGDRTGFEDTALYQFVEQVIRGGTAPVEVTLAGAGQYRLGQPILVHLSVVNRLGQPLSVRVMEYPAPQPAADSDLVLWLVLRIAGGNNVPLWAEVDTKAAILEVPSGGNGSVTIDLSHYYDLSEAGSFQLQVSLDLPAGDKPAYRDSWFRPLYPFSLEASTSVPISAWGMIKRWGSRAEWEVR